jgi:23S rRNA (adenine-N6)-dimethyltransferase
VAEGGRRWGWHQLDADWARALVEIAGIRPGELVVDVGAGKGAVTRPLVDAGARVIAVELHFGRAQALRETFGSAVTVVRQDACDLRLPTRPFSVVASVPYAVTSPLLRRLTQRGSRLVAAHLVVQAQAAHRWSSPAAPAAVRWRRTFDASLGPVVPRKAFTPRPAVDSRVLVLRRTSVGGR